MKEHRRTAANFLKEYRKLRENEKIIREQMFQTERMLNSLRISNPASVPNFGGGSRYEDFLVTQISKKDELRLRLVIVTSRQETIKRIVGVLLGKERKVIERFFIEGEAAGAAEDLMESLMLEKSQIYRLKDSALDKIYTCIMGCPGLICGLE